MSETSGFGGGLMSAKSKARRKRQAERQAELAQYDAALSIKCPACGAEPGVWCFVRSLLGPDMHERRYAATSKES